MNAAKTLNIFNGDCLAERWRNSTLVSASAKTLCWREIYLEGPLLRPSLGADAWSKARADFLADAVPDLDAVSLRDYLTELETALSGWHNYERAVLWFDTCIHDFVMLLRIFWLCSQHHASGESKCSEVLLVCDDNLATNDCAYWYAALEKARKLTAEDFAEGAALWQGLAVDTSAGSCSTNCRHAAFAAALENLSTAHPAGDWHPNFSACSKRLLAELTPGLNRTCRQLLDIVHGGISSPVAIFTANNRREEIPFLGDTGCYRRLDQLAAWGYLQITLDNRPVHLRDLTSSETERAIVMPANGK